MQDFNKIKEQFKMYIENRHLYVLNIIKSLYNPLEYKSLCEVGAGNMELSKYLARYYQNIDAYEPLYNNSSDVSNLNIYGYFHNLVDIFKYDLMISICPYCYTYDIYDGNDQEETIIFIQDIINRCLSSNIDLFLVLANTHGSKKILEKILNDKKSHKLVSDTIDIHYKKWEEEKVSTNNVLILKK